MNDANCFFNNMVIRLYYTYISFAIAQHFFYITNYKSGIISRFIYIYICILIVIFVQMRLRL